MRFMLAAAALVLFSGGAANAQGTVCFGVNCGSEDLGTLNEYNSLRTRMSIASVMSSYGISASASSVPQCLEQCYAKREADDTSCRQSILNSSATHNSQLNFLHSCYEVAQKKMMECITPSIARCLPD